MSIYKKVVFTISALSAFGYSLTIEELKSMPKSIERDFYIWKFLKEPNTTKDKAIKASSLIYHVNGKLDKAYYKKSHKHLPKKVYRASKEDILKYSKMINRLLKSGNFYQSWLKLNSLDKLNTFVLAGTANRKLLNKKLDSYIYRDFQKNKKVNQFIYRAFRENLTNLKTLILDTQPIKGNKITYRNLMKLGFKNLLRKKPNMASWFFESARAKAKNRFYADNSLFWLYMATKNSIYLKKLANSYDYNIYKLIALDFLNRDYPAPPSSTININRESKIDITNPIEWAKLKKKIFSNKYNLFKLAQEYNSLKSSSFYYYILNKAYKDTKQYFPMPYRNLIYSYGVDRQALIYAIARQESRFIPSSVSSSFAVGMMQFMPFLVKHISKQRGENISLDDMFKPAVSLRFANTHLNYLNKHLYHPLFVAYAYNAGIGYTRRLIRKNIFKSGKYEPYISLEMVDNDEARYYGKRVLGNYIIYKKLLGSPVKITTLLNQLDKPELTDRFR